MIRTIASIAAGLALASVVACKRAQAPTHGPVWDEEPGPAKVEALGTLSPPWSTPVRIVFDNGLVTFWLHEPNTPALHVRLFLPVEVQAPQGDMAATRIAVEALRWGVQEQVQSLDATATVVEGPGRLELAVHGHGNHLEPILAALGNALASRPEPARFNAAARRVAQTVPARPSHEAAALAVVTAQLLGLDPAAQQLDRTSVAVVSSSRVGRAWKRLVEPHYAVLAVHSGRSATEAKAVLNEFDQRWDVSSRVTPIPALQRLRPLATAPSGGARLLAEEASPPIHQADTVGPTAHGRPVVVFGRVLSTPDQASRALARLAQRILQETVDARLTVSGNIALFTVVVELDEDDAARTVERAVRGLSVWSRERQSVQRLFQATQVWLGARVVQASLDGEDWTHLWSDALDLASGDETIALALARDAAIMLDAAPKALETWQRNWLDPLAGHGGWQWVVAGASAEQLRSLKSLGQIAPVATPPR